MRFQLSPGEGNKRIHVKNTCVDILGVCWILSPSGYKYIVALEKAFIAFIWHGCAVCWLKAVPLWLVHYAPLLSCCIATLMMLCHYISCFVTIYHVLPPSYCFATVMLLWLHHAAFPLWHGFAPMLLTLPLSCCFASALFLSCCISSAMLLCPCHVALTATMNSNAALLMISWLRC